MSRLGKFLLLFSFLSFLFMMASRLLIGGWENALWIPFALWIGLFILVLGLERRVLLAALSRRSTKHGMNMGVLIVFVLIALICVNFLAVRYEKTFDWTSEKLNSLSDQSVKAVGALKSDTEIVLLYRKKDQQGEDIERAIGDLVSLYEAHSQRLRLKSYNALKRPDLAKKYDFNFGPFAVYAVQGERKVKIERPNEQEVTRALLKLSREKKKIIYFTSGHGERALDGTAAEGLSQLMSDLSVTYDVRSLTLYSSGNKVPDDAEALAIIGPQNQFIEPEIQAVREYLQNGGHLLLALDPGMKHNLAKLTKSFGVEFANNYVLDLRSQVVGGGPSVVLGTDFSGQNEITKAFGSGQFVLFNLASSLKKAPDVSSDLKFDEWVKTDARSMSIDEIRDQVKYAPSGPHAIALSVSGALKRQDQNAIGEVENGKREFSAVVVGDSDFMSNGVLDNNLNRDFVLNSIAQLTQDHDLISIRPRAPKGTKLELTNRSFIGLILFGWLPIPLLLFGIGGYFWWRRRSA